MDLWPVTLRARESLLSTLDDLGDDQWDVASLCDGWTNRQVLAHLILAARPPARRYAAAVLRGKGSFDRANHLLAVEDGRRSPQELLAQYRGVATHQFSPPGWPKAAPLSDILLHSLDIRVPLGIEADVPPGHFEPVMGLLFSGVGRSFTSKGTPKVRWMATDHGWTHGSGSEVRGTMEDLALTAAGRGARVDTLDGEGVADIRRWLT